MSPNPKPLLRRILFLLFFCCFSLSAFAQYVFNTSDLPSSISVYPYAEMAAAGQQEYLIEAIVAGIVKLDYTALQSENTNIGFTKDHYWVRLALKNETAGELNYFLETARPVTDLVHLYIIDPAGKITQLKSGDAMPFPERSFGHRKPIFRLKIQPKETLQLYLHLKSDGEVINMPLLLRSPENLLWITVLEQLVFGIFYGILLIAFIIYLFFYFGIREKSFLFYSCYVLFIGLMQFSLDGYFHQYFMPDGGWFSNRAVLVFACISTYFLGKYAQEFLRIKNDSTLIPKAFNVLYVSVAFLLLMVLFVPAALEFSYPLANVLGLMVLLLIVSSMVTLYLKKGSIDAFFTTGIVFLILGFVVFILNNFSLLPNTFLTENSSKFGTGLEVVFLSLSMANFIRRLKNEKEEFNRLALARSEEMSELKTYFLSNISHELRTPLNAIMNLIDSISSEVKEEGLQKNCQIIKYSSLSLLSSVNDILDFSKIEKGELQLETLPFHLKQILDPIQKNAKLRAKDQGLDFRYSTSGNLPELLLGDANRLGQIVNNIFSNAIKFTTTGFVQFHLDSQPVSDQKVRLTLTISDSGVGIAKEKMERIFDSFTQESINNQRKFGGLGLGLYIVKTLVDMQGGTIAMTSELNEGTTCIITLDYTLAAAPRKEERQIESPIFDLNGASILIVEDNAINQMVLKMITKKWLRTTTVYANNGQEALNFLQNGHFDIVLMDLQMPVMDGYEATIAIRNGQAGVHNSAIPIVAVTADVMESTQKRVQAIGMNHYLSKPLQNETLYRVIQDLIS